VDAEGVVVRRGERVQAETNQQFRPISFATDIRPLFRAVDRSDMLHRFDLWSHVDVVANGAEIAERIADGSLPADHPWPDVSVSLFDRWLAEGAAP
jgi:hypothetical protein